MKHPSELGAIFYAIPPRTGCCVYMLMRDNTVVYVGKTKEFGGRVAGHFKSKTFDSAYCYLVDEHDLDSTESVLIDYFKPEYNGKRKGKIVKPKISRQVEKKVRASLGVDLVILEVV